jgi:hypothetical protein
MASPRTLEDQRMRLATTKQRVPPSMTKELLHEPPREIDLAIFAIGVMKIMLVCGPGVVEGRALGGSVAVLS